MRRDDLPTVAELVAAERANQGLPRKVDDPAVLERVATLLDPPRVPSRDGREAAA